MESDIRLIIENAGPNTNYERGRQLIYEKAKNQPIDVSFASRRGSAAFLAEFTARAGGSALRSIGSITETVEDLVARIDLNAEWIPKFARWQAMLLSLDAGFDTLPASIENLEYLEFVAGEVERLSPLVEALPDLVGSEREAVLAAITEERIAVLEAIAEERSIVLDTLRAERTATFEDLDALMDKAFTREVNKMFFRGLILIAILLAGFSVIAFLFVRALRQQKG